ncbi:MAG: peptidase S41 [Deltaproteobacteria bacterium]|nr:MAG: peptidase S41 [Deltaproteobacteria bacterium]
MENSKPAKRTGFKRITLLLILVAVLGVLMGGGLIGIKAATDKEPYESLKVFTDVLHIIEKDYVKPVKTKELIYGAIKGMLSSLDPHSSFMTPKMYKEMQVETKGSFGGLGIEITMKDGVLTVIAPIADTPAYKAGIKAGDQIIAIEGKPTKNMTLMDTVRRLRGKKGTKVTITIMRKGFTKPKDITIVRAIIKIKSVKSKLYEGHYAYIRITQFQERTDNDFVKAVQDLKKKSNNQISGLILDLRNNPGGLLNQAVKIADRFISQGLIVSIKGRDEGDNIAFQAKSSTTIIKYPVVVLTNAGSASASEIVAGAIQDHHRGVIMGGQTFGKGSVQTIIPLSDGSGLRLTTALYYTPSGRSIQAEGITPDIMVSPEVLKAEFLAKKEKAKEHPFIKEKDLAHHLENVSGEKVKKEKKEKQPAKKTLEPKDPLIERAIEVLKGAQILGKCQQVK